MSRHHAFPAIALAVLLGGCSGVFSAHPLGEPMTETIEHLDGVYVLGNVVTFVKQIGNGELRLAFVEWEQDHFELQERPAFLTAQGDVHYVNTFDPEKEEYAFLRLAGVEQDATVAYAPDADAFARAVDEGRLSGEVDRQVQVTTVRLTGSKAELDAFVNPAKVAEQFRLDEAVVFRRVVAGMK